MPNETTVPAPPPQKSLFNLSTAQQIIQLAITIASVVIVLVGLWLTTRISPLVQDIALVKQAQADYQRQLDDMKSDITQIKINTDLTKNDVSEIKGMLQSQRPQSSTVTRTPVVQATPQPSTQVVYSTEPQIIVVPHPENPQPTPETEKPGKEDKEPPPGLIKGLLGDVL